MNNDYWKYITDNEAIRLINKYKYTKVHTTDGYYWYKYIYRRGIEYKQIFMRHRGLGYQLYLGGRDNLDLMIKA